METDQTQQGIEGGPHPTLAELRDPSHPNITEHLQSCSMCRSIMTSNDAPIVLDLPKGLVSEAAFRWPADPIARGGMAQIFAGEDRRLGRPVILKAPREGDELPAGMNELFQRRVSAEARILAKLQHPSIVTIYELGKATVGGPFCVLQHVEGVSLRDRLDELAQLEIGGPPRTRERLELLSNLVAIAEALAYAHERRIVHRDCTPNNILLGKRGEATLIDWGIARDLDAPGEQASIHDPSPSMSGRMVTISAGTPPYLPLEQTQGRAADPSFDVYSFGITLYEVVAGRTPFEWKPVRTGAERTEQLEAFLTWLKAGETAAPAMPRDPELSGIIARAMSSTADQRFTADELVRALKQYLTGDLVFSHRYSATGRLARWARRHRAVAVGLVSLLLFAIGGALVWVQLSRQARIDAELREVASAAKVDASEKGRAADDATHEAEVARARADQAVREGKDAEALTQDADRKRRAAEAMRHDAESAAVRAKGTADDAIRRYQEATKAKEEADLERDAARTQEAQAETVRDSARNAEAQAEKERDAARVAQNASERDREAAKQAQTAAEKERDSARGGQRAAEKERELARAAETTAETDRDAARAAQTAADKERDDARRKLVELEARLRAAERAGQPEPPAP
jgi:tRNA A-37 threonylcarbamoyl transferase component Bud32